MTDRERLSGHGGSGPGGGPRRYAVRPAAPDRPRPTGTTMIPAFPPLPPRHAAGRRAGWTLEAASSRFAALAAAAWLLVPVSVWMFAASPHPPEGMTAFTLPFALFVASLSTAVAAFLRVADRGSLAALVVGVAALVASVALPALALWVLHVSGGRP
ncbi:hypothetical protein [Rugosimonospora africana]|uniref:Uncharacterized protein n=1 Tax=Rugosimonospora africana TaxID=556532 RepID=A0A8J3QYI2_9ACTN|nr:hypothetical protein [Rugosimonospora africana]GIH17001.1 hypothetical protein Raf01_51730 [Rugosimonospora africana]